MESIKLVEFTFTETKKKGYINPTLITRIYEGRGGDERVRIYFDHLNYVEVEETMEETLSLIKTGKLPLSPEEIAKRKVSNFNALRSIG